MFMTKNVHDQLKICLLKKMYIIAYEILITKKKRWRQKWKTDVADWLDSLISYT